MLVVSWFCPSYLNYKRVYWDAIFTADTDKDVQKTMHHTTAASQANIYWAPIIALFLHYYIQHKHTILGHGFVF